ncbi:hypothetical protein AHF37_12140 [Paragonimus kellicotti]|nr:hypothetical protein AHF37_12140 [Paragonimus kellicotti]
MRGGSECFSNCGDDSWTTASHTAAYKPNGNFHLEPAVFRMTVNLLEVTSSTGCLSFALNRTIRDYRKEFPHPTLSVMKERFYVVNCLFSFNSVEDAQSLAPQFRVNASNDGFNLTKWISNDSLASPVQPINPVSSDCAHHNLQSCYMHSTLGVMWNVHGNYTTICLTRAKTECIRRDLLSFTTLSRFALNRTTQDYRKEFPHPTLSVMKERFYVVNCLFSFNSVEDAQSLAPQFRVNASNDGFNLTKWISNDSLASQFSRSTRFLVTVHIITYNPVICIQLSV